MDAVRQMLTKFRLEQYAEAFDDEGYDDLPFLMSLNSKQLKEVGEATKMKPGHYAKFEAMLHAQPSLQTVFEDALGKRNRQRLKSMIHLAAERSECTTRTLQPGQVLFEQGDNAEAFYVVDSGA